MKVLSYNIFWRAQLGKIENGKKNSKKYLKNIISFIDQYGPYHFVGLQEAVSWDMIRKKSIELIKMHYHWWNAGEEDIITFWDSSRYQLDEILYPINGHLEDISRPFSILFFQQKLCVINLHAGHRGDIYKFDYYLVNELKKLSSKDQDIFKKAFQTYDIIMMGDFNNNLQYGTNFFKNNYFEINEGRKLNRKNIFPTCCDPKLKSNVNIAFDHILTSFSSINIKVFHVIDASDHLPVIAEIFPNKKKKVIGFDFDGVLHKDVTPSDFLGQRHPLNQDNPFPTPFEEIINLIKKKHQRGDIIYIITARINNIYNKKIINEYLDNIQLKLLINGIYLTSGEDKTKLINNLKINDFYDDSCLRINELYYKKINGQTPTLKRLYLVTPENNNWIKINHHNIEKYCSVDQFVLPVIDKNEIIKNQTFTQSNILPENTNLKRINEMKKTKITYDNYQYYINHAINLIDQSKRYGNDNYHFDNPLIYHKLESLENLMKINGRNIIPTQIEIIKLILYEIEQELNKN